MHWKSALEITVHPFHRLPSGVVMGVREVIQLLFGEDAGGPLRDRRWKKDLRQARGQGPSERKSGGEGMEAVCLVRFEVWRRW